jgi:serine/threonine-protein kinase
MRQFSFVTFANDFSPSGPGRLKMTTECLVPTAANEDSMDLAPGQLMMDHEVIGELGSGGMGKVYRVRNLITGRVEALKLLRGDFNSASESGRRFLQEIKICAALDHPNIVALRTAFRWKGRIAMVMEFVEGMSLEKRMASGGLTLTAAIACVEQTLQALAYAHGQGVVHRDIKPANMICGPCGKTKLLDFGLAKEFQASSMTTLGRVMGSVDYMSPEQIQGAVVDQRTDIYSMGVTLYELATGVKPFHGPSDYSIMAAHLNTPVRPPLEISSKIPWALNEIILIAMNKSPDFRFQSAQAFRTALQSIM